ncbi:crosslink repair DNA glycosylase YcaQ family protein [Nonomuraea sp. NPDC049421]|uniref:DNA glycosylase AlkZ-like family protein n=1 Tax=Nonomuraea sp. NPDC049421 TaxID=3155275 RepID=UPI00342D2B3F
MQHLLRRTGDSVIEVTERMTRTAFGRRLPGVDLDELAAVGRALLEERPMTFAELGKALAERRPQADPRALGQTVRGPLPSDSPSRS